MKRKSKIDLYDLRYFYEEDVMGGLKSHVEKLLIDYNMELAFFKITFVEEKSCTVLAICKDYSLWSIIFKVRVANWYQSELKDIKSLIASIVIL